VISYTPLRSLYRELDAKMEMKVRRNGKEIPITYLPRGKPIESYRWVRIAEVPEERCREM